MPFSKDLFSDKFIVSVDHDITLLREIYNDWFKIDEIGEDPKYNKISSKIYSLLQENASREKLLFSLLFADTAAYVYTRLKAMGLKLFLYTGKTAKTDRDIVKKEF